jgi:hypothetical protein
VPPSVTTLSDEQITAAKITTVSRALIWPGCAEQPAWRDDHRWLGNEWQTQHMMGPPMACRPVVDE